MNDAINTAEAPMKTQRVAPYARVSTKNNGQDPETQLIALREYRRPSRYDARR